MGLSGKIGIVLNLTPSYPRSNNEEDLKASFIADLFFNRSFTEPAINGIYPVELIEILKTYDQLPEYESGDRKSSSRVRLTSSALTITNREESKPWQR